MLLRNFVTLDNDPDGEHDFGKIALDEEEYFFKIDYYDPTLTYHSPDPRSRMCNTTGDDVDV